jgi:hypothetical protein
MNITRKLTNAKLERKRTHNLRKNTQTVNGLLADFLFLMLDSDSVAFGTPLTRSFSINKIIKKSNTKPSIFMI